MTEDKEEGLNADEIDDLLREASIYPNENSTNLILLSSLAGQIPLSAGRLVTSKKPLVEVEYFMGNISLE